MWEEGRFEGVFAKLSRANEQIIELERRLIEDRNNAAYGILTYMDERELIVRANLSRQLLIIYSVLAGESVYQMRSALDHLIFALVPGSIGFPVFGDEHEFDRKIAPKLDSLDAGKVTYIKSLQPFKPDHTENLLYVLHKLWNRDKHRLLLFTKVTFEEFWVTYTFPDGTRRNYPGRKPTSVADRSDLKRMRQPSGYTPEVEVVPHARFGFYFDRIGLASRRPALELLRDLLKFCNAVVGTLTR